MHPAGMGREDRFDTKRQPPITPDIRDRQIPAVFRSSLAMPVYRLLSTSRDRNETPSPHGLPIEAPSVRHAAARVLGRADEIFCDRTGEAWLVAENGARVWSLSLDTAEAEGAALV